jgi:hypothetical protein
LFWDFYFPAINYRIKKKSQALGLTPAILPTCRQRSGGLQFEAILGKYFARTYLKKKKKKKPSQKK